MKTIFNGQFDFDNNVELELVLNNLNPQMAIKIIEIGIQKGLFDGIFDLTEAHCLYKSIQYFKNVENERINNNVDQD